MFEEERKSAAALISGDPAFAALEASGTPIFAVTGAPPRLIYLNAAARELFGEDARVETIFGPEAGAARLAAIVETAGRGAAPRLERLPVALPGGAQAVTILCRRIRDLGEAPCFAIAALGVRAAAPVWIEPAAPPAAEAREEFSPDETETQSLRRELLRRHGATPPRFLWKTDADGRFVEATHVLADVAGAPYAALNGRAAAEISKDFGLDPAFAAALATRRSWSGVSVDWPLETPQCRAPVTLGAMPIYDGARNFLGFRGFGVMRLAEAQPRAADPAPLPVAEPPTVAKEAAPGGFAGANVVALRPNAAPPPRDPGEALSPAERSAFEEIARTLVDAPEAPAPAQSSARELIDHVARSLEIARPPEPAPAAVSHAAAMLDVLPVGVLVARGAALLYANRTLLDYLGYADLDALEDDGGLARMFMGRLPARAPAVKAMEVMGYDGETQDVDAHLQTIDWDGLPATLVSLRRQRATAPPRADEAALLRVKDAEIARLAADNRMLDACFEASGQPAALVDAGGRVMRANPAFAQLFGAKWQAGAAPELAALLDEDDARETRAFFAGAATGAVSPKVRGPDDADHRLALTRLDAAHFFCAATSEAAETARREAESARDAAERANAAKSAFLARVSHEIRTPLGAILGFAEVMMEERFGPIGSERYKEYLRDVHASGGHVLSLVNDLLDLSKIEAGKMELLVQPIDVNAVIGECVSIMQPQASRQRVIVRLSLTAGLPRISADERSLRQILLNLLSNAIKFNEPGGQVIVSSTLTETGEVLLRVKDTGIGMSPDEIGVALEPFRQLDASNKAGGTGLGLPVTKALIEANRASFAIQSRKNEGTLIEVAFPQAPAGLAAE